MGFRLTTLRQWILWQFQREPILISLLNEGFLKFNQKGFFLSNHHKTQSWRGSKIVQEPSAEVKWQALLLGLTAQNSSIHPYIYGCQLACLLAAYVNIQTVYLFPLHGQQQQQQQRQQQQRAHHGFFFFIWTE